MKNGLIVKEEPRYCTKCHRKLSVYNLKDICFRHYTSSDDGLPSGWPVRGSEAGISGRAVRLTQKQYYGAYIDGISH